MKLKSLKISNFRGIKEELVITMDDLTVMVGKNDAGKSTVLEALDIFFNECKSGFVKIDSDDVNVFTDCDHVTISCVFNDLPETIILDTTVETQLSSEHLLNEDGELEIKKVFKSGKLKEVFIVANYPTNEELANIHTVTITQLRQLAREYGLTIEDSRKSSLHRKAIFEHISPTEFRKTDISVKAEGGKQIWSTLSNYIPLYMLFQSDRKNEDKDDEIQNPMKFVINEVLKRESIIQKLNEVYQEVEDATNELASNTLEKLAEMNPELASELKPEFQSPSWGKVFGFGLKSDSCISVNKRGSGVRRLILLNFFRAEAERRKEERGVPNIIYAYEEPETSQHPNHQRILMDSFVEMSHHKINQVILTTHSPEIAKLVPVESLRLIKNLEENVEIGTPNEDVLNEITEALGVLPTFDLENVAVVKVAVCVEGANDISFLRNINEIIPELQEICDLNSEECIMLPMGGSSLKYWVNNEYLKKLKLSQVHIYDSDVGSTQPNKYSDYLAIINATHNAIGYETNLREMENYITPTVLIDNIDGIEETDTRGWATIDVPELIAARTHDMSEASKPWEELTDEKKKKKVSRAKHRVNTDLARCVTKENLEYHNYYAEIESWFRSIGEFISA